MDGSSVPALPGAEIAAVQVEVAREFGIAVDQLKGRRQDRRAAGPRHVAMYLARDLTHASSTVIGRHFGDRDHTTVLHALGAVEDRIRDDGELAERVSRLRADLASRFSRDRDARLDRDVRVNRHIADVARWPLSATEHFKRLARKDPEALAVIVAAGVAALRDAAGATSASVAAFDDHLRRNGMRPAPRPGDVAEDVRFIRSRGVVVHRDLDHPDRPIWFVDGKGSMGPRAVAEYAAKLRQLARVTA